MGQRYVVTWRKPAPDQFDWDHDFCDSIQQVEKIVAILLKDGVHQYSTYPIGDRDPIFSSSY